MTETTIGTVTIASINRIAMELLAYARACEADGTMPDDAQIKLFSTRLDCQAEMIRTGVAV